MSCEETEGRVSVGPRSGAGPAHTPDLAERSAVEQTLLAREAELREAQRIAKVGNWTWDAATDVVTGSDELYRIFGVDPVAEPAPILSQQEGRLFPAESWRRMSAAIERALRTGEGYELDLEAMRNGTAIWITTRGVVVRDAGGAIKGLRGTVQDITERKQTEEKLRESERHLNRAQEIAHLGSWVLDLVANSLTWSDEVYRIFGLQPQEFGATYEAFLEAVHPDDRAAVDAAYSGSVHDGRDFYEIEHSVVRKSTGEVRFVHERCEHVRDGSGRIIRSIGMVHDITERKRTQATLQASQSDLERANTELRTANVRLRRTGEELAIANEELLDINDSLEARVRMRTADLEQRTTRLRALAAELTRVEEQERRRVAQLIHDHLQQLLAVARINVDLVTRKCQTEALKDDLQRVDDLLGESLAVARSLTAELSPTVLYRSGLAAALEWLARWYEERHALSVTVTGEPDGEVESEELRIALFGSIRELLFNVVKHARVRDAQVRLSREGSAVKIVVSDSGVGFDPEDVRAREGTSGSYGLFSLRERLESLGCGFEVESAPDAGTRVTIVAPAPEAPTTPPGAGGAD